MLELDDNLLLREYVEHGSEKAFATLVARHVNKVYSIALRHTRNAHQAEEITQAVFVTLARKSRQLGKQVILSGWLCRTARLSAVTFIRSEIRRSRREQEAHMQKLLNESESEVWSQIAPLLDAAMAGLSEADHDAIALRFFDGKSMKEIGAALGASEDATKMRVNRAVEKLRIFFTRRGIVCSAAALTAAISAHAVQTAPVGLALTVSTAAAITGKSIAATASAATIKTIAMTTSQKVLIAAAIIAVGIATPLVIQHQAKLREENARSLSAQSQRAAPIPAVAASENDFPRESWAFRGYATPEFALVSLVWAAVNSDVEGFLNSLSPEQQSRVRLRWQRQGLSDETQFRNSISNQFGPIKMIRILNKEILSDSEVILRLQMEGEKGGTGTVGKKAQRIGNEWKIGATL
jgi:RNA polymerase sigma factor (sigma-70 family)